MKHQSKLNHKFVIILITFFSSFSVSCQSITTQLDKVLSTAYDSIPTGASVLITQKDKVLYERQFGKANLKSNLKVSNKTKFQIGSLTKQFTAAAILLLQERGKLKTSDYLGKYLQEFNTSKYPVKIEHLLTHTSGIASGFPSAYQDNALSTEIPPSEVASYLSTTQLQFNPGENYEYSNNGYIMLGLVIEVASGQSYKDFIHQHIFKPLKMKNSMVAKKDESIKNMAQGYAKNDDGILVQTNKYTSSFSAGAIVSTPRDLRKWIVGLRNDKIINKTSRSEMFKNYTLLSGEKTNVGYGWEINKVRAYNSFEHSGFEPGFKTNSIYIPEKDIYIIVCQNTEEGSAIPITITMASILVGKPYPKLQDAVNLNTNERNLLLGTYLIPNNEERYVGYSKDFGLYYKKPGGKKRKLYALNDSTLYFSNSYVRLKFSDLKDTIGFNKFTFENRIIMTNAIKKSSEVPHENKIIALKALVLENYVGTYVSDQFTMQISLQGNTLYAQPNGSDKLALKPKSENSFFIEEIGAEIEFNSDEKSDYINIILEGNKMKGIKQ